MAAEQLQIQVQANVSNAISGLNDLNKSLATTNTAAVKTGTTGMQALTKSSNQATFALNNFGRVAQDAPFGLIGIANNIDPLVQSFVQLRKETGSGKAALAALTSSLAGGGGLILGVSLLTSALQFAQIGLSRWGASTKQAKEEQDELTSTFASQYTEVLLLTKAYQNSENTITQRRNILSQLNEISDKYFGNLSAEKSTIEDLQKSYDAYIDNLIRALTVKQLEADLQPLVKQLAAAQATIVKLGKNAQITGLQLVNVRGLTGQALENARAQNLRASNELRNLTSAQRAALSTSGIFEYNAAIGQSADLWKEINDLINGQTISIAASNQTQKGGNQKTQSLQEKINDLLKDYKNTLQSISYEEQIKGINLSNERLETNLSFLKRAAELVGLTGDAYKKINKDTQAFAEAAANQKIVEVIKNYKDAITELDIKQAITGQDQLNARINSTTDALIKLRQLGVSDINDEFIKLKNTLNELKTEVGLREFRKRAEDIAKTWNRLQLQIDKLNFNKTKDPLDILKSKIDAIGNAISELKSKGLTEKDLGVAILTIQFEQLGLQYDKLKKTNKALGDEIKSIFESGAVNAFTSLFESIVEGENAFDALRQSVKRLVIELGNAIIKTLVLQAIQNIAAPGTGGIGKIGTSGFLPGVRFDQLRFAFFR